MSEFYRDDQVTLLHGRALDMLKTLPDGSVNCCVTSPPYFGLRDYGEPGQYGLEKSPPEYVANMRVLLLDPAEVEQVLDGAWCPLCLSECGHTVGAKSVTRSGIVDLDDPRAGAGNTGSSQGPRHQINDYQRSRIK